MTQPKDTFEPLSEDIHVKKIAEEVTIWENNVKSDQSNEEYLSRFYDVARRAKQVIQDAIEKQKSQPQIIPTCDRVLQKGLSEFKEVYDAVFKTVENEFNDGKGGMRFLRNEIGKIESLIVERSQAATGEIVFAENDRVEAKYRGNGRYYLGRITKVHENKKEYDILHDDGDRQRNVKGHFVRRVQSADVDTGILLPGDQVNVRFQRKKNNVSGEIIRAHADDTYDVQLPMALK